MRPDPDALLHKASCTVRSLFGHRPGVTDADLDDLTQEAALAAWLHQRKGGRSDWRWHAWGAAAKLWGRHREPKRVKVPMLASSYTPRLEEWALARVRLERLWPTLTRSQRLALRSLYDLEPSAHPDGYRACIWARWLLLRRLDDPRADPRKLPARCKRGQHRRKGA